MSHPTAPIDYARLHEQAHRRAMALRRQAITELTDDLGRALQLAFTAVVRTARRWAGRLSPRHLHPAQASRSSVGC